MEVNRDEIIEVFERLLNAGDFPELPAEASFTGEHSDHDDREYQRDPYSTFSYRNEDGPVYFCISQLGHGLY